MSSSPDVLTMLVLMASLFASWRSRPKQARLACASCMYRCTACGKKTAQTGDVLGLVLSGNCPQTSRPW